MKFEFLAQCLSRFVAVAFLQEDKGIKKYGHPLNPKDDYDWITMTEEEMADGWKYLQCVREARDIDRAALRVAGDRIRELERELSQLRAEIKWRSV